MFRTESVASAFNQYPVFTCDLMLFSWLWFRDLEKRYHGPFEWHAEAKIEREYFDFMQALALFSCAMFHKNYVWYKPVTLAGALHVFTVHTRLRSIRQLMFELDRINTAEVQEDKQTKETSLMDHIDWVYTIMMNKPRRKEKYSLDTQWVGSLFLLSSQQSTH